MAQVDDELAIRAVLAAMTADQPPAPPNRYGAVRRRAVVQRRRTVAGAAVTVAILVLAALAIPLGLLHIGQPPPVGPSRHYHVLEHPPGPGSRPGLIAFGVVDHLHWTLAVQLQGKTNLCTVATFGKGSGTEMDCAGPDVTRASRSGAPASTLSSIGTTDQIIVGTVRSDVARLAVAYNNGQVLMVYPVAALAPQYARYFVLAAPYSAAVTEIVAYSRQRELGYAVPFTGDGNVTLERWLRPGQPALPRPATVTIGAGTLNGHRWHEYVDVGPWGTCFEAPTSASFCFPVTSSMLHGRETARVFGASYTGSTLGFEYGEATPSVQYLIVTTAHGSTAKVPVIAAGSRKFFAFSTVARDPVVRWAAYDASGRRLASGPVLH